MRFAFESREPVGIEGEDLGENLQRDVASARVARAIDLAHPAAADECLDLIDAESLPNSH